MAPFYGWGSTALRLQSHCEPLQTYYTHKAVKALS